MNPKLTLNNIARLQDTYAKALRIQEDVRARIAALYKVGQQHHFRYKPLNREVIGTVVGHRGWDRILIKVHQLLGPNGKILPLGEQFTVEVKPAAKNEIELVDKIRIQVYANSSCNQLPLFSGETKDGVELRPGQQGELAL